MLLAIPFWFYVFWMGFFSGVAVVTVSDSPEEQTQDFSERAPVTSGAAMPSQE